jgi:hypothetical protein
MLMMCRSKALRRLYGRLTAAKIVDPKTGEVLADRDEMMIMN